MTFGPIDFKGIFVLQLESQLGLGLGLDGSLYSRSPKTDTRASLETLMNVQAASCL